MTFGSVFGRTFSPAFQPKSQAAASTGGTITVGTAADTRINLGGLSKNFGASTVIAVGRFLYDENVQKSLLRFNLSSITGSVISASLDLFIGDATYSYANTIVDIYKITDANGDWIEGTANAAVQTGSSCWFKKVYDTTDWAGSQGLSTADTDYVNTVIGTFTVPASFSVGTKLTASLSASVVNEWMGEATNNGILLRSRTLTGSNQGFHFCTKEHATESYRPTLTVTYS